jgi:hypothetical protein
MAEPKRRDTGWYRVGERRHGEDKEAAPQMAASSMRHRASAR